MSLAIGMPIVPDSLGNKIIDDIKPPEIDTSTNKESVELTLQRERDGKRFRELWNMDPDQRSVIDEAEMTDLVLGNPDYWDNPPVYEMRNLIQVYEHEIEDGQKRENEMLERKLKREEEAILKKDEGIRKAREDKEAKEKALTVITTNKTYSQMVQNYVTKNGNIVPSQSTDDTSLNDGVDLSGTDVTNYFVKYLNRFGSEEKGNTDKIIQRIQKEILPSMCGGTIYHRDLWRFSPDQFNITDQYMLEEYEKNGWSTKPLQKKGWSTKPLQNKERFIVEDVPEPDISEPITDDAYVMIDGVNVDSSVFTDDDDDDLQLSSLFDEFDSTIDAATRNVNVTVTEPTKSTECAKYVTPGGTISLSKTDTDISEIMYSWDYSEVDSLGNEHLVKPESREYGINTQVIAYRNLCEFDSSSFNNCTVSQPVKTQVHQFLMDNAYYISKEMRNDSVYIISLKVDRRLKKWKNNRYQIEGDYETVFQESEIYDLDFIADDFICYIKHQGVFDYFMKAYDELINQCCGGDICVTIEIEYVEIDDFIEDAWKYIALTTKDGVDYDDIDGTVADDSEPDDNDYSHFFK